MTRDEDGSAVVELVWLGILLLVPILWIVLSVFAKWEERLKRSPQDAPDSKSEQR